MNMERKVNVLANGGKGLSISLSFPLDAHSSYAFLQIEKFSVCQKSNNSKQDEDEDE